MPFKYLPWDFFNRWEHPKEKAWVFVAPSCLESLFLDRISLGTKEIIEGKDVVPGFIETLGQGLFGRPDTVIIKRSQDIQQGIRESILDLMNNPDMTIIFSFSKSPSWIKKFTAKGKHIEMLAPRFWEFDRFAKFWADQYEIAMPQNICAYFGKVLTDDWDLYEGVIKQFQGCTSFDLQAIQKMYPLEKISHFELAEAFSTRQWKKFYSILSEGKFSFEDYRRAIRFLQGHLLKMVDINFLEKKAKNRYEKQIVEQGKKWRPADLEKAIVEMGKWEILLKKKDFLLIEKWKLNALKLT